jgi:hypothetical protein
VGRGLTGTPEGDLEKYTQLGRYTTRVPPLNENLVYLKYPSTQPVPSTPPFQVADQFRDLLLDTLRNHRLDPYLYSGLSDHEKTKLGDLAVRCRVARGLGTKAKKPNSDDFGSLKSSVGNWWQATTQRSSPLNSVTTSFT